MRRPLFRALRKLYHGLPISLRHKLRIKSWLFTSLPWLFRSTVAYRNWGAVQRSRGWAHAASAGRSVDAEGLSEHVSITSFPGANSTIKVIAFYLPQFHPIAENDHWWGKGFTEWTNVTKAKPQFAGHYQPHLPGELGFYDLRLVEVQRRQIELARMYGIHGFCYYHYWFGGQRLLERPFQQMLQHPELDFPFCICWANENWTRAWDGMQDQVLIGQSHSPADDIALIRELEPALRDERYIRVDGRPLIVVYRPASLPDPKATAQRWRDHCRRAGLGEIFLACTWAFEMIEPDSMGFDAAIEFPPNNAGAPIINDQLQLLNPDHQGVVYDYRYLVEESRHYERPEFCLFRGVTPGGDNEARRPGRGSVFALSSPAGYAEWLENACKDTRERLQPGSRLVFVNAWNEWAEGAHLEPDRRYGYAYLQATLDVLRRFPADAGARRIVYVSHDAHPHGAQLLSVHILRTLKEVFGYQVDLLLLGEGPLEPELSKYARVHDCRPAATQPHALGPLLVRLRAEGARAALVNTCASGALVEPLKAAGFRLVGLVHEMPGVIHERALERRARSLAELADTVVFASPIVRDRFKEVADLDPSRSVIRPQGLYLRNPYRDQRDAARARVGEELRLPAAARIVLGVGFADYRKGIDLFAQVAARVAAQRRDVVFVWVGNLEPEATSAAVRIVRSAGCHERVLLPGARKDPAIYYAAADVFLLTSREDPFPSVVLEAMDGGVPVVGFDGAGGFRDVIEQGAGILAPHLDTERMALTVSDLLDDPQRARGLGARGRALVEERFGFVDYACDLLQLAGDEFKRVSVVVPNYNYAHHLPQRLHSVFGQSYPVFEVIVLDDASTDTSLAVIDDCIRAQAHDVTLLRNERNSGSVFAQWLKGIEAARGELVWIAEADDFSEPRFLEEVVRGFEDPHVVLSYCQSRQVNGRGTTLSDDYLAYVSDVDDDKWRHDYCRDGRDEIQDSLAIKNTIPNASAAVFRRTALVCALAEERERLEQLKLAGDWVVYLNVARRGKVRFVAQSLNNHRRHEAGVTQALDGLHHVGEIARVQRLVQEQYTLAPEVAAKAAAFSQAVYEQFGLATPEHPTYETHPEIVAAVADARAAPDSRRGSHASG